MSIDTIRAALSKWDDEIARFAGASGFESHDVPASHYPRKRIVRNGEPLGLGIFINVESDENGKWVEEFTPTMCCRVLASSSTYLANERKWAHILVRVAEHIPYQVLTESLHSYLEEAYARIKDITLEDLIARGERRGPLAQ